MYTKVCNAIQFIVFQIKLTLNAEYKQSKLFVSVTQHCNLHVLQYSMHDKMLACTHNPLGIDALGDSLK